MFLIETAPIKVNARIAAGAQPAGVPLRKAA
jgi:hypothetical protein